MNKVYPTYWKWSHVLFYKHGYWSGGWTLTKIMKTFYVKIFLLLNGFSLKRNCAILLTTTKIPWFLAWPSFENRNASGWKFKYTQTFAETHQKFVWIFNDATLFGYLSAGT